MTTLTRNKEKRRFPDCGWIHLCSNNTCHCITSEPNIVRTKSGWTGWICVNCQSKTSCSSEHEIWVNDNNKKMVIEGNVLSSKSA